MNKNSTCCVQRIKYNKMLHSYIIAAELVLVLNRLLFPKLSGLLSVQVRITQGLDV